MHQILAISEGKVTHHMVFKVHSKNHFGTQVTLFPSDVMIACTNFHAFAKGADGGGTTHQGFVPFNITKMS